MPVLEAAGGLLLNPAADRGINRIHPRGKGKAHVEKFVSEI